MISLYLSILKTQGQILKTSKQLLCIFGTLFALMVQSYLYLCQQKHSSRTNNTSNLLGLCLWCLTSLSTILSFITFMVLYSIIKPNNSFFVINSHIARQEFILNDLFSGGRNPVKILKFTTQMFSGISHTAKINQIPFNMKTCHVI